MAGGGGGGEGSGERVSDGETKKGMFLLYVLVPEVSRVGKYLTSRVHPSSYIPNAEDEVHKQLNDELSQAKRLHPLFFDCPTDDFSALSPP